MSQMQNNQEDDCMEEETNEEDDSMIKGEFLYKGNFKQIKIVKILDRCHSFLGNKNMHWIRYELKP